MSGTPAEWALQTGIRTALIADDGVKAVLGDPVRVFDEPPADPDYPYATFGRSEARPVDADASGVMEHVVHLHVWSRYGGRKEIKEAIAALRAALHDGPLTLDDHVLVSLRATFADVLLGRAGRTHQAILRLRAVTETAA